MKSVKRNGSVFYLHQNVLLAPMTYKESNRSVKNRQMRSLLSVAQPASKVVERSNIKLRGNLVAEEVPTQGGAVAVAAMARRASGGTWCPLPAAGSLKSVSVPAPIHVQWNFFIFNIFFTEITK